VGVSKQAVFKRMNKEPLKSALASLDQGLVIAGSKKIYLSDNAEAMIKRAFLDKNPLINIQKSPSESPGLGSREALSPALPFSRTHASQKNIQKDYISSPDIKELKNSVDLLVHQLEVKDQQLREKDDQLRTKDEQIKAKDDQIKDLHQNIKALTEGLSSIHKLVVKKFYKILRQPSIKAAVSKPSVEMQVKQVKPVSLVMEENKTVDKVDEKEEVTEKVDKSEKVENAIEEPNAYTKPYITEAYLDDLDEDTERLEAFHGSEKNNEPGNINEAFELINTVEEEPTIKPVSGPIEDEFDFDFPFLRSR